MMTLEEIAELQEQLDGETALTARDLEALICNLRIEQARLERLLREQRKVEDTTVLDRPSDQTLDLAHRVRIYIDVCLNRQRKAEVGTLMAWQSEKFKETTKARSRAGARYPPRSADEPTPWWSPRTSWIAFTRSCLFMF